MRTVLTIALLHLIFVVLLVAILFSPATAYAGLFDDDAAHQAIAKLQGQFKALQQDISNKANGMLELLKKNEELHQEIADLRGQYEVLGKQLADIDARLHRLEPYQVILDGKTISVKPDEEQRYNAALSLFKNGTYSDASQAFKDFITSYPHSDYIPWAQYWLGNALYAQRDYKNAIVAQRIVAEKYPDNPNAADALLNIVSSYHELNRTAEAKKTVEFLIKHYPNSSVAQKGREYLRAQ